MSLLALYVYAVRSLRQFPTELAGSDDDLNDEEDNSTGVPFHSHRLCVKPSYRRFHRSLFSNNLNTFTVKVTLQPWRP